MNIVVDDIHKMLKALIKGQLELSTKIKVLANGQSELSKGQLKLSDKIDNVRSELLVEIGDVHREVSDLRTETKNGFNKVNDRMDMIGKSLAYLEGDTPTCEDFDNLEVKVAKIEQALAIG